MTFHDWWTNENNPSLPKEEYLFGTRHITMIVVAIVAAIVLSVVFYKRSSKAKKILLTILALVLLFFEITSRVVNLIITTDYSWQSILKILLPMHICSVAVVMFIISFFTKQKTLMNFATVVGLLATVLFMAYPAVGINKTYITFTCLYSIVSHVTGFVMACLLINLGFTEYKFKNIWKLYLCFAIMFLWGVIVDFIISPGSNYMYIIKDPLELNLGFPYQILYGIILVVYIFMFYFISFIIRKIKSKKVQNG